MKSVSKRLSPINHIYKLFTVYKGQDSRGLFLYDWKIVEFLNFFYKLLMWLVVIGKWKVMFVMGLDKN